MATKIVTKNSSTASAVPTASDLVQGELAVNVADKRLFTEDNAGAIVELGTNPSGNVTFQDNGKAIFGAGSDLQIYHDGSDSYIKDEGTGNLYLTTNGSTMNLQAGSDNMVKIYKDAQVEIFHDASVKLATTSTGIDVTGNVTMATGGSIVAGGANDLILNAGESGTPDIYLQSGGSTKVKVEGSNGNVGIGLTAPDAPLSVYSPSASANIKLTRAGTSENLQLGTYYINSTNNDLQLATTTSHPMVFKTNNSERMRIDSSGNLLVGTTDTNPADNGAGGDAGHAIAGTGYIASARSGDTVALFNRMDNDGNIVDFRKNGTAVGSIGNYGGLALDVGKGTTAVLRFRDSLNAIYPAAGIAGGTSDGVTSLGISSGRFNDIYATNGTIQTSDRNEKQDIAELSDAEQRVAVACKGLLRKFRWKDSVAEKGDEARTHFGIIAQDLQAAFAAEGLDAGDYAMFISSTWTDEETNEEKTRMGVRYSELLAFIISAI